MFTTVPDPLTAPQLLSESGVLVKDRFQQAEDYADEAWREAWALLDQLRQLEYPIEWTPSDVTDIDLMGLDGLAMTVPTAPSIDTDIAIAMPSFTGEVPTLTEIDISTDEPPAMNVPDPGFNLPDAPDDDFPVFSENAPQLSDISYPTKPTVDIPAVPQLTAISIPSPPDFNIADFEATMPTTDLTAPEPTFTFTESLYDSSVLQELKSKLLEDLQNGGSGLDEETEQAIYDRATSRLATDEQRVYDEALEFWSARGWTLPPGPLAGQIAEASATILRSREDLNNDILIQQSKLAQENTHFIITSSLQNEKQLMDLHNNVQQRAFEVAKFTVEAAVMIYGIKVEAYKAQLEAYKAAAEVYKAKIQVEIAKAELYKAQIQGIMAVVEVDKARIEAYQAQIQGITILIELYKAEMEGAQIRAEVDKTRIQSFGALVDAYRTQVQAVTAKYEAYRYQVEGETAKAEMYKAQVGAYEAQVGAYKARADVDVSRAQVQVELNRGRVDSFRAQIDMFRSQIEAAIAQVEADVKVEGLEVNVYEAQIRQYQAEVDATVRAFLGRVEELKAQIDLDLRESEVTTKTALAKYEMATESIRAAARVSGQLAASAMAVVSASADISHRENRSDSTSLSSYQGSTSSNSSSVSVNTNINKSG